MLSTVEAENITLHPCINDDTPKTLFEPHYFYQGIWAGRLIYQNLINNHVDVGSELRWVGSLTVFTNVIFVDIRPFDTDLPNLKMIKGNILNLPFDDNSIQSLSSMHVIEHIGLGRYGDKLDPEGTKKACKELQRILIPGGNLYISCPIGKPKTCFNAHRIHSPQTIIDYFDKCKLVEMAAITDNEKLMNCTPDMMKDANYACGLFWLRKNDK